MNYLVGSFAYAQNRANSVLIVLNELGVSLCRVSFGESNKNIYITFHGQFIGQIKVKHKMYAF